MTKRIVDAQSKPLKTHREIPTVAVVKRAGADERDHQGGENDQGDGHHEHTWEALVEKEEVGGETFFGG